MKKCSIVINPLKRDGTSQPHRFPEDLAPELFPVDEKQLHEFLAFAEKFAQQVQYWDETNAVAGDWVAFFERDPSIVLAHILNTKTQHYRDEFNALIGAVEDLVNNGGGATDIDAAFDKVIRFLVNTTYYPLLGDDDTLNVTRLIEDWNIRVAGETNLDADITGMIRAELIPRLKELMRIHYELNQERLAPAFDVNDYDGFGPVWGDLEGSPSTNWSDWFDDNLNDALGNYPGPLFYTGSTLEAKLFGAIRGLKVVFEAFFNATSVVLSAAPAYLEETLEDYDLHEPYLALYITFLRLYRHGQDKINTLTQRHLDFFYRDVLRMIEKDGIPDRAHIVFRLRDNVDTFRLPEGSRLSAGEDANGAPLIYETEKEIVVNRAAVTEMKTIFLTEAKANNTFVFPNKGVQVYAAPVANSSDGLGGDLDDDNPSWKTFGEDQEGKLADERTMPDAALGFAISSPQLQLSGGHRIARFIFRFGNENIIPGLSRKEQVNLEAALCGSLKIRLSGEKNWIEKRASRVVIVTSTASLGTIDSAGALLETMFADQGYRHYSLQDELAGIDFTQNNVMIVELELGIDEEPVVAYNPKNLDGGYDTPHPIAEFVLDNDGKTPTPDNMNEINFAYILAGGTPAFPTNTGALFQGNFYRTDFNGVNHRFKTLDDYQAYAVAPYDEDETYIGAHKRRYDGKVYKSIKNSTSPVPEGSPDFWKDLVSAPPVPIPGTGPYDPNATYTVGKRVTWNGRLYEAIKASVSPLPDRNPAYWQLVDYATNLYELVRSIAPRSLVLKVDVRGLKDLVVENDFGPLPTDKPFEPFGFRPDMGSRFYIGSGEAFGKKLNSFSFDLTWLDPPADFAAHYAAYSALMTPPTNASFIAKMELLDKAEWKTLKPGGIDPRLFDASDATLPIHIEADLTAHVQANELDFGTYGRARSVLENVPVTEARKRGFVRLELIAPGTTFGHEKYGEIYTKAVLTPGTLPNEPYTPQVKSISMNYTSEATIDIDARAPGAYAGRIDRFFHIHPFGQGEVHGALLKTEAALSLVPLYDSEGHLLIGVRDLDPPQSLSLLFQLAEGSGDPDINPGDFNWQVLSDNEWLDIPLINIVSDSTNGFRTSGIFVIDVPKDANSSHSILPDGLFWFKVSVSEQTVGADKTIDILAQAVTARFLDEGNDPNHLAEALAAGSIGGLEFTRSEIDTVAQPFGSFGGKMPETGREFYTRVSERLRHKARSSTVWDYERIVLEEFPDIYKVKCLNHTNVQCEIAPGHVTVVTIPNLRNKNAVNVFEPRTSLDTLGKIGDYLSFTVSPCVNLAVVNPLYEVVRVCAGIGLRPGYDPGYYSKLLAVEIQRFLSPWAFSDGEDINFGGRIHRSWILNFIEERPYIDYVVQFRMDHIIGDTVCENVLEAVASTSRSILVSALDHVIVPVKPGEYDCEGSPYYEGVDFWILGTDFFVQ